MLTVVDRPLIQHVVDEALEAGIEHLVFITGRNKGVIEDHFDRPYELEDTLRERNKLKEMDILERDQPEAGTTSFTRQQAPLGLGHAVWCARDIIGNEPFAVLLPDVLVKHKPSGLKQMIDAANAAGAQKANIVAVEEVPMDQVHMYGVVGVGKPKGEMFELNGMVEKPQKDVAPSNLSITGATFCSRRSSTSWKRRSAARAARSSSPTPCSGSPRSRRSTASSSRARATIAVRSRASSPPTSPMRWTARICAATCSRK